MLRLSLVALALTASGTAAAQDAPALASLDPAFRAVEPKVVEWRRDFHQHPELSNRETQTAAKVAAHLTSLGMEVESGVAKTGVVGVLRGGRPGATVALRADMDGLPVEERTDLPFRSTATGEYNGDLVPVSHACGHDTHMAILMGAAEVLAGMRDEIAGTVVFLFQPAEEGAPKGEEGGAELMVKEGVLTRHGVDAAFALHINSQLEAGHIGYRAGGLWAGVDDMRITVKGRQSHGAYPWLGADPVVTSAQIITALQTVVSRNVDLTENPAVVTVGSIHGGVRSNIIPEQVEMIGTVRTLSTDDRALVNRRIRELAEGTAAAMGLTAEVEIPYSASYPVTSNDPALTAASVPALVAAAGADRVHVVPPRTGAEDFSFFAREVPGFYFVLGGRPPEVAEEDAPAHHTPDFFVSEAGLPVGVRAMTGVALAYLEAHAGE